MAWTAPMTAAAGAFTAAQFNTHIRDNLLVSMPGVTTTSGTYVVATAANALAQRIPDLSSVITSQTTTSTSYTDLATSGPSYTCTTGTRALVSIQCYLSNSLAAGQTRASVAVSGATTIAADDDWSVCMQGQTATSGWNVGVMTLFTALTAGSNTFTMKYRVSSGTGTFIYRTISVIPF